MVAGVIVALLVGFPALRLRGLFLAVTTLAFAVAATTVVVHARRVPRATGRSSSSSRATRSASTSTARAPTTTCALPVWSSTALVDLAAPLERRRSSHHRRARQRTGGGQLRHRAVGHQAVGLRRSPARWHRSPGRCSPGSRCSSARRSSALPTRSTSSAMTVIGGLGSITGACSARVYVVGLPALFGSSLQTRLATSGIGLLFLLLYFPGGLAQLVFRFRDRLADRFGDRLTAGLPATVSARSVRCRRRRRRRRHRRARARDHRAATTPTGAHARHTDPARVRHRDQLRRCPCPRRRVPRRAPGRDRGPDRFQRRGQVDADEHHLGVPRRGCRVGRAARPRRHRAGAPRAGPPRYGPGVPGRPPLPWPAGPRGAPAVAGVGRPDRSDPGDARLRAGPPRRAPQARQRRRLSVAVRPQPLRRLLHRRPVDRHAAHRGAAPASRRRAPGCCCSTSRRPVSPSARPRRSRR